MRSQRHKSVSILMLVIFVMGLCAHGFNSKWLAHEIDHHREMLLASIDHGHAAQPNPEDSPEPIASSDAEHRLLHALGHFESVSSAAFNDFGEPPARMGPLLLSLLAPSLAELESPFRPPRSTSLL